MLQALRQTTSEKGLLLQQIDSMTSIFSSGGKEIMCAKLVGGHWEMQIEPICPVVNSINTNKIWYECYSHLSNRTLSLTQKHVHGLKLTSAQSDPCHSCIASKLTRCPFPKSVEPRERRPLDLLHMDIDVVNVPSWSNKKYFLFFTDDCSGYRFGFAITSRSGQVILDCLLSILPYMERQTGNTLMAVQ
jgi:hypothetical protein